MFGIPQGSFMGPILFVVYINDLPHIALENNCTLTCFADDTYIVTGASTSQELVTKGTHLFKSAEEWFHKNKLIANKGKTKLIAFSTSRYKKQKPISVPIRQPQH